MCVKSQKLQNSKNVFWKIVLYIVTVYNIGDEMTIVSCTYPMTVFVVFIQRESRISQPKLMTAVRKPIINGILQIIACYCFR